MKRLVVGLAVALTLTGCGLGVRNEPSPTPRPPCPVEPDPRVQGWKAWDKWLYSVPNYCLPMSQEEIDQIIADHTGDEYDDEPYNPFG